MRESLSDGLWPWRQSRVAEAETDRRDIVLPAGAVPFNYVALCNTTFGEWITDQIKRKNEKINK